MPTRFERTIFRWLARVAILFVVTIALWHFATPSSYPLDVDTTTLYQQQKAAQEAEMEVQRIANEQAGITSTSNYVLPTSVLAAAKEGRTDNAIVVASMQGDNTSWLDPEAGLLPGWERNIYIVNKDTYEKSDRLRIPKNKGREAMVYLSFIIDNYFHLPNATLFLHSKRYQWHNDDPDYDGRMMLRRFRVNHLLSEGYANLRCCHTLGCPDEIVVERKSGDENKRTEEHFAPAFQALFPGEPVPPVVGVGCCAQFGVTRAQIQRRPIADYIRIRDWLIETPHKDALSGRIMEYSWHMMFGKSPIHCPSAAECYCKTFGLCDLKCGEGTCEGRYKLPQYSTIPEGWPFVGWEGEKREPENPSFDETLRKR